MLEKKTPSATNAAQEKLVTGITELIALRKQKEEVKKDLKNFAMFANLDAMMGKLPEEVVEDLNMQFVTLTHTALKNQRQLLNQIL